MKGQLEVKLVILKKRVSKESCSPGLKVGGDRKGDKHLTATLISETQDTGRVIHDTSRSVKCRTYISAP